MTKIKDVRYKWSKLFAAKNFGGKECVLAPIEQQELLDDLDTAASAIEKVHDEEMVGFAFWMNDYRFYFCKSVTYSTGEKLTDVWQSYSPPYDKEHYTTAQLLQLYKNR